MRRIRTTWVTSLAVAAACALPRSSARAEAGHEVLAVASFTADAAGEGIAPILTSVAESLALEHAGPKRFVAHGQLARHLDRSPDRGCRTSDCLTRAAAALGATLLIPGGADGEGGELAVRVELLATADGHTVASVRRGCDACGADALPAMLEQALRQALDALGPPEPVVANEGHTVILRPQRLGRAFRHEDIARTIERRTVVRDGVELSALTLPDDRLSCVDAGAELRWRTTVQAVNTAAEAREVDGVIVTEVFTGDAEQPVTWSRRPLSFDLGGAGADEGAFDGDGVWIPPASVGRRVLDHSVIAESTAPLRMRVSWEDELLEELLTRPLTRFVDVVDLYLARQGQRTSAMPWGEEAEVHLVLTKRSTEAPAEVTLRVERQIRFWFDTDSLHATYEIAAEEDGTFHLVLPFSPGAASQESSEGVVLEAWVNGCMLMRSQVYR